MTRRRTAGEEALVEAVRLLDRRELVAYPSSPGYALGADALDGEAVLALREVAGTPSTAAVPVALADIEEARHVAHVTPLARRLAALHLPGPLALVLDGAATTPEEILGADGTVEVRVPASGFALELARRFGPLTALPAARAGGAAAADADEAETSVAGLALVVDGGAAPRADVTRVDARGVDAKVLNAGAVRLD